MQILERAAAQDHRADGDAGLSDWTRVAVTSRAAATSSKDEGTAPRTSW
jgi:hypothetical protein